MPDGRPGWSHAYGGCRPQSGPLPPSQPPAPGLTYELILPQDAYRPGDVIDVIAVVTNHGDLPVQFITDERVGDGTLVDDRGQAVSAEHVSGREGYVVDVPARGSVERRVMIQTAGCADTALEQPPLLPNGDYLVVASLLWASWSPSTMEEGPYRWWHSMAVPVLLDPAAPAPPVRDYYELPCRGNGCGPPPTEASCERWLPSSADYGADRSLRLSLDIGAGPRLAGQPIEGRLVVANDSITTIRFPVYAFTEEGQLLTPAGTSTAGRWKEYERTEQWEIPPGGSVSRPVTLRTRDCGESPDRPGEPVPTGEYDAVGGLYVKGFGWWFAEPVRVLVVNTDV